MSLGITMVQMIPVINFLFIAWWLAAGWFGVRLYRRLTGWSLTVGAGARLGSLTGLFTFIGMAALFGLTMASSSGREVFDQMIKQDPRMTEVINNPTMLGAAMLMVLFMVFALVVGICAAGGALGARFTDTRSR